MNDAMTTPGTTPGTWSPEVFAAAVGDAIWAPSFHNSQPWRFHQTPDGIDVRLDEGRRVAVGDPDGRMARISCGAAVFNLRLALAVAGRPPRFRIGADGAVHLWPAVPRPPMPLERRLHRQIERRHTNRGPFADCPVDTSLQSRLAEAARREGGRLDFVVDESAVASVAGLIRTADARLRDDPAYVAELRAWSSDADHDVQGIAPSAAGAAPHPEELLTRRDFGGPASATVRDASRQPIVAVLSVMGDGPDDAVVAGMVLQCVLLTAADLGLTTAMYSQPVEVPAVREQLRCSVDGLHDPQLVLRFGYAPDTCYTNRRPVADVIDP